MLAFVEPAHFNTMRQDKVQRCDCSPDLALTLTFALPPLAPSAVTTIQHGTVAVPLVQPLESVPQLAMWKKATMKMAVGMMT